MRIGTGYDVHKLVEGRDLIIGGVKIDHTLGLLGHSDADVLLHAIADAVLPLIVLNQARIKLLDLHDLLQRVSNKTYRRKINLIRIFRERSTQIGRSSIVTIIAEIGSEHDVRH